MKRSIFFIIALLISGTVPLVGQQSGAPWRSPGAGLDYARSMHVKVMVDVYADWCKWCKKLDADVYTDPALMSYLEHHFILVKLNAESTAEFFYNGQQTTEQAWARAFGIKGLPTILFLDGDGKLVHSWSGYLGAPGFLTRAKFVAEEQYETMSWEEFKSKGSTRR